MLTWAISTASVTASLDILPVVHSDRETIEEAVCVSTVLTGFVYLNRALPITLSGAPDQVYGATLRAPSRAGLPDVATPVCPRLSASASTFWKTLDRFG